MSITRTSPYRTRNTYSSSLLDDKSDRRTLEELCAKLFPKDKKGSTSSTPNSSKYKQLPMTKFCTGSKHEVTQPSAKDQRSITNKSKNTNRGQSKGSTSRKKVSKGKITKPTKKIDGPSTSKSSNIGQWLRKDKSSENIVETKKQNNNVAKKQSGKNAPLVEKNKIFKRSSSGSFDKYGMSTPSLNEISRYKKELEDQKRCMEIFDNLESSQDSIKFNIEEPKPATVVLDCKHLTDDQITEAFNRNFQYLNDIYRGVQQSKRHHLFEKGNCKDHSSLNYNTSMITFTIDQKHVLLSHLDKAFNEESSPNTTRYFFKVLLPELCTKIFMDTHNMTYDEANKYLESRPVPQKHNSND